MLMLCLAWLHVNQPAFAPVREMHSDHDSLTAFLSRWGLKTNVIEAATRAPPRSPRLPPAHCSRRARRIVIALAQQHRLRLWRLEAAVKDMNFINYLNTRLWMTASIALPSVCNTINPKG